MSDNPLSALSGIMEAVESCVRRGGPQPTAVYVSAEVWQAVETRAAEVCATDDGVARDDGAIVVTTPRGSVRIMLDALLPREIAVLAARCEHRIVGVDCGYCHGVGSKIVGTIRFANLLQEATT